MRSEEYLCSDVTTGNVLVDSCTDTICIATWIDRIYRSRMHPSENWIYQYTFGIAYIVILWTPY